MIDRLPVVLVERAGLAQPPAAVGDRVHVAPVLYALALPVPVLLVPAEPAVRACCSTPIEVFAACAKPGCRAEGKGRRQGVNRNPEGGYGPVTSAAVGRLDGSACMHALSSPRTLGGMRASLVSGFFFFATT